MIKQKVGNACCWYLLLGLHLQLSGIVPTHMNHVLGSEVSRVLGVMHRN